MGEQNILDKKVLDEIAVSFDPKFFPQYREVAKRIASEVFELVQKLDSTIEEDRKILEKIATTIPSTPEKTIPFDELFTWTSDCHEWQHRLMDRVARSGVDSCEGDSVYMRLAQLYVEINTILEDNHNLVMKCLKKHKKRHPDKSPPTPQINEEEEEDWGPDDIPF